MAFVGSTSKQSAKVLSAKIAFPPICKSFLPQKFSAIQYTYAHSPLLQSHHLFSVPSGQNQMLPSLWVSVCHIGCCTPPLLPPVRPVAAEGEGRLGRKGDPHLEK